ncbi:BAG family molecular chaperone regulator 4 isoform X1 [Aquila chrysaetos chrysaetos]|uniref:BAG cochaperone 4 n=2 Tax=Aquila chrysaetos chrysaetos TaxID=223781 RepID=A0A663EH77_AQUCH|nr:BAG family molecular chaperone regulator 4 isoform X1 [Aquila chrysaetos chrysaetos]
MLQEGPVLFFRAAAGPDWSPSAPCLWPITFSLLFPSPQAMDSPYANGAYSPPYPPAPGAAPHYTGLPQTRGYYCSAPSRTPYPAESTGMYRPSSPAPPWSYAPPDCPAEGSSLRRQQVPGYSPPQTPGMPIPQYPYGDSNPGVTAQGPPPQPRPPEDTWAPPTVYGVQPRYAWPAASVHGNPFVSESHPPWTGSGASSHPPVWDSKDTAYSKPEQSANQPNYYSDVNHQHSGTMNDHKPATPLNAKPSPSNAKVQYSAQPQMYDTASRKLLAGNREAGFKPGDQPSTNSAAIQPEIQRILHVMGEAEQLGQEVDEFVGKKTDKSYRLLEEMLTKLLLELDSIETGGQDSVRQARKESVHRIQAILEKLERKGL